MIKYLSEFLNSCKWSIPKINFSPHITPERGDDVPASHLHEFGCPFVTSKTPAKISPTVQYAESQ